MCMWFSFPVSEKVSQAVSSGSLKDKCVITVLVLTSLLRRGVLFIFGPFPGALYPPGGLAPLKLPSKERWWEWCRG